MISQVTKEHLHWTTSSLVMVTHSDIPPAFSSSSLSSSSSLESSDWLQGRRGVPTTWAPFLSNETLPRLKTNNCDTNREENCEKIFHLFSEAWKVGMIRDDRFGWSNLVCTTWGVIVEILLIAKKVTRHRVLTHTTCKRRSPIILANTKDNNTNNIFCTIISLAKATI